MLRPVPLSLFVLALAGSVPAQQAGWQSPPEPIASLVVAEPAPSAELSPCRRFVLFSFRAAMPGIDVLARPHRKLAGSRIDPRSRGPQFGAPTLRLVLRTLADGSERTLAIPEGQLRSAGFSADGERLAVTRATDDGIELWLVTTQTGAVQRVPGAVLNAVLGAPAQWLPDQQSLLVRLATDAAPPAEPTAPLGPGIQETVAGQKAQVRTNQDMLQNEHDAQWFEHLATCRLARVDARTLAVEPIGEPGMIARAEASPDGEFLLVGLLGRPFSYLVPWQSFPQRTLVWRRTGEPVRPVHDAPLTENVPIGGVPVGPRGIDWLPTHGHVLTFVEALDGGDPRAKAKPRDRVQIVPDLAGIVQPWTATEHRAAGLQSAPDGRVVLREFDRDTRRERTWLLDSRATAQPPTLLYERSTQDVYGDPGALVTETLATGAVVLRERQGRWFRAGQGASKDGDRPFLDAWDPAAGVRKRLWQCGEGRFETFLGFLDDDRILIRSESPTEPPDLWEVTLGDGKRRQLTRFVDPAQEFARKIEKRLLRYQRQDGVALSGTLYLPPEHRPGDRHPVLVWAYPQEFTQASDAGQVRSAPTRYTRFAGISHLWLLLHGYAVLDDAAMPIVGPVRTANDSYVQQLCWNAEAAVRALMAEGVADERRLAVAGHSYGAFMTANLLVHTKLFAAGIARSGAYNRTLTPFGFQNEERTYWEAPEVYQAMSPFAHADRIKAPLLLIHGEDDDNQGTWPIQSQRLFAAIKGHGGTARLCLLPHEAHGYRARESTLQCLAEMCAWLDRYLAPPKADGK